MISESQRVRFLSRIMRMFTAAIVLVAIAVIVLVLVVVGANLSGSVRRELRDHEREEALARRDVRDFVAEQHVTTRQVIGRFRRRIAQLEDFILKQGLEPPANGNVFSEPTSREREQTRRAKEGPKPGTPGGPPVRAPQPQPESPNPQLPPMPSPSPTETPRVCIFPPICLPPV